MTGNPTGTCFGNYSGGQYLSTEITPKIRRTITTENSFSELVILAVIENGALSEAHGYCCTYSFGGRLDRLGWRALQYLEHYAESMRLMQAAWREVGVSLCALLHQAIARSGTWCVVRAYTRVNSVKLPACAIVEVFTEGSQDRTHGM